MVLISDTERLFNLLQNWNFLLKRHFRSICIFLCLFRLTSTCLPDTRIVKNVMNPRIFYNANNPKLWDFEILSSLSKICDSWSGIIEWYTNMSTWITAIDTFSLCISTHICVNSQPVSITEQKLKTKYPSAVQCSSSLPVRRGNWVSIIILLPLHHQVSSPTATHTNRARGKIMYK